MKFTVMRAFFLDGDVQPVGSVVDIIDRALAGGLQHSGKVKVAQEGANTEIRGPMTRDSAGLVAEESGPVRRTRNNQGAPK